MLGSQVDTIDAGWNGEGLETKERLVSIPSAARSKDSAERGKEDVAKFLSLEIENL